VSIVSLKRPPKNEVSADASLSLDRGKILMLKIGLPVAAKASSASTSTEIGDTVTKDE